MASEEKTDNTQKMRCFPRNSVLPSQIAARGGWSHLCPMPAAKWPRACRANPTHSCRPCLFIQDDLRAPSAGSAHIPSRIFIIDIVAFLCRRSVSPVSLTLWFTRENKKMVLNVFVPFPILPLFTPQRPTAHITTPRRLFRSSGWPGMLPAADSAPRCWMGRTESPCLT